MTRVVLKEYLHSSTAHTQLTAWWLVSFLQILLSEIIDSLFQNCFSVQQYFSSLSLVLHAFFLALLILLQLEGIWEGTHQLEGILMSIPSSVWQQPSEWRVNYGMPFHSPLAHSFYLPRESWGLRIVITPPAMRSVLSWILTMGQVLG